MFLEPTKNWHQNQFIQNYKINMTLSNKMLNTYSTLKFQKLLNVHLKNLLKILIANENLSINHIFYFIIKNINEEN